MSSIGKIVVNESGNQIVLKNGQRIVFNKNGTCIECLSCLPHVIASHTTTYYSSWNLSTYQGDHVAPPNSHWRIRETSYNLTYYSGVVDNNGKLVGLPNAFNSNYSYSGYMRLEIGCPQPNGTIKWS
ncbi:MAG: hypothetical protein LBH59_00995 [Planctomycetaceae bacterium]|jgi:hypothetical protein|nr:hypothetical protein [Planctomycetaceae bacterium]